MSKKSNRISDNEESPKIPARIEIASFYILENYSPIKRVGYSDSDMITSADLIRELSEMASVTVSEISELMWGADFSVTHCGGKIYWQVYRKDE